jgi:hypothetical protein
MLTQPSFPPSLPHPLPPLLPPHAGSGSDSDSADRALSIPPLPVPIDVTVRAPTRAVIITGPNTGGKTATLKALGLAVLAAKCGLPVPAAAPARLPCFDAVLADIGGLIVKLRY